jgi:hypothetical protein
MVKTNIVECGKCSGLLLTSDEQKSRICPYCGTRVDARRARVLASAEDAFTASEVLRELKKKKGFNRPKQT